MDTGHTSELLLGNDVETPSLWEGGTGALQAPVSSHCPQASPATACPSADGLKWTMGPGHRV